MTLQPNIRPEAASAALQLVDQTLVSLRLEQELFVNLLNPINNVNNRRSQRPSLQLFWTLDFQHRAEAVVVNVLLRVVSRCFTRLLHFQELISSLLARRIKPQIY